MALINAFDRYKHFDELDSPLDTAAGVLTPAQRRALCLANLFVAGDTVTLPGTITFSGASIAAALVSGTTSITTPKFLTATNVGTVTTSSTTVAEEHGDGVNHITKLTMTAFAVGTSGDNASLGIGAKFYTFPAGTIEINEATIVGGLTAAISVTTNTPEVGIGTVIASGAVAVLSGTATFEDVIDGNTSTTGGDTVAPDVAGGTFYKGAGTRLPVMIKTTGGKARDLFLNCAVAWADVTAPGAVTFTGVITLKWKLVT